MSKYDKLWKYISESGSDRIKLTFDEIAEINGVPIDHSFLTYKKELSAYGYKAGKISLREKTADFFKEAA